MISFVTKLGVVGGAVSGVVLINPIIVNLEPQSQEQTVTKTAGEDFKTIEDIELFERAHGCTFAYIESWGKKTLYTARSMLKDLESRGRKIAEIIEGANRGKQKCKEKKGVITLNNDGVGTGHNWAEKTGLPAFWDK